jgi:hypothetical protein
MRHEHSLGEGFFRLRMDGVVGLVDIKRPCGWLRRKRNIEVRNRWVSIPRATVWNGNKVLNQDHFARRRSISWPTLSQQWGRFP